MHQPFSLIAEDATPTIRFAMADGAAVDLPMLDIHDWVALSQLLQQQRLAQLATTLEQAIAGGMNMNQAPALIRDLTRVSMSDVWHFVSTPHGAGEAVLRSLQKLRPGATRDDLANLGQPLRIVKLAMELAAEWPSDRDNDATTAAHEGAPQ